MKMFAKEFMRTGFLLALMLAFVGCPTPADNSGGGVPIDPDAHEVKKAKESLKIGFETGDTKDAVTQSITLPETLSAYPDVAITWVCDPATAISTDGVVTRTDTDQPVKITATLTKNGKKETKVFNVTVVGETNTDKLDLSNAKNKLSITYSGEDASEKVTQNVTLPTTIDGVDVAWTSSDGSTVSTNGTVNRGEEDTTVTLTATLTKGTVTDTKEFILTVLGTNNDLVAEAKNSLAITYESGDSASSVTKNVTLGTPTNGVDVAWASSDASVVSNTGTVIPTLETTTVTLTATLTKGTVTDTKEFTLTVLGTKFDQEFVDRTKNNLRIDYNRQSPDKITRDFGGGIESRFAECIAWSETPTGIITVNENTHGDYTNFEMEVTRPDVSTEVTLTATITKNSATATKEIKVTVYGNQNEAVDNEIEALKLDATVVLPDVDTFSFPSANHGTTIVWTASHTEVINTNTGAVTHPATKTDVTVTATVSKGSVSRTKDFTVTVYPATSTVTASDLLDAVIIPSTVEKPFELPIQAGVNSATISWSSSDSSVISIESTSSGKLANVKPEIWLDKNATLTASVHYGGATATKDFVVTVKGLTEIKVANDDGTSFFQFTKNTIVLNRPHGSKKYAYTIDRGNKTITAHITHVTDWQTNDWMTIDEASQKMTDDEIQYYSSLLNELKRLDAMSTITLQDLKPLAEINAVWHPQTDEEIFNSVDGWFQGLSFAEFQALTSVQKSEKIKAGIQREKEGCCEEFGISSSSTYDALIAAIEPYANDMASQWLAQEKAGRTYSYEISYENSFGTGKEYFLRTESMFDNTKPWYEQKPNARYSDDGTVDFLHEGNGWSLSTPGNYYEGQLNNSFTSFTGTSPYDPNATITVPIVDNGGGTITVTINGKDYTLNFEGISIR